MFGLYSREIRPYFLRTLFWSWNTGVTHHPKRARKWNFGQSERVIRDVALVERMLRGKRVTVSHEIVKREIMENSGKETALKELCSCSIDILSFELGKLCPGVGILFSFFDPGAGVFHWKAVPEAGILTENSGPGVSRGGGGVTGQIDTCINKG